MSSSYKGCPVVGPEKDALVSARRQYKKAIKDAKQSKKRQKTEKLKEAVSYCDSKQFWNLVKKDCNSNVLLQILYQSTRKSIRLRVILKILLTIIKLFEISIRFIISVMILNLRCFRLMKKKEQFVG